MWTYATTDPARETKTMQNGDFEDGLSDWQVFGDSTTTVEAAAFSGTQVAVLGGVPSRGMCSTSPSPLTMWRPPRPR
ncbi:MAG: hypothetical protein R2838_00565 [Caldilineaceae bacterium]